MHNEVWQPLKELQGFWQPADEVPSKYAAKLTQLGEVAGITYYELHPGTILCICGQVCNVFVFATNFSSQVQLT